MRGLKINYMGRGQIYTNMDIATTVSKRPKGQFCEKVRNEEVIQVERIIYKITVIRHIVPNIFKPYLVLYILVQPNLQNSNMVYLL